MSCRHNFANRTCASCWPGVGMRDPGPEDDYGPNLDGPGAVPETDRQPAMSYTGFVQTCKESPSMIRVVAGLHLNHDGQVLMQQRPHNKRRPGMWEWPGGKVDLGELDVTALKREWDEELGVRIRVHARVAFASLHVEDPMTMTLYRVSIVDGLPAAREGQPDLGYQDPLHAIQWLPCAPMTYQMHQQVMAYMEDQRRVFTPTGSDLIRGVHFPCEDCGERAGSGPDTRGFRRCNNCGYPGQ